ncbi:hypothetical protein BDZ91DRAFT_780900 [Kalaharituber pfeilii]|nr:hypothetical protein BDZ91DRAFT_780900 [Kalaharituber pfeilii]
MPPKRNPLSGAAITKGNLNVPVEWPTEEESVKPKKWGSRRGPSSNYGQLKGARLAEREAENVIEEVLAGVLDNPDSGIKVPEKPDGLPSVLETFSTLEQGDYMIGVLKAKSQAMRAVEVLLKRGREEVEGKCGELETWVSELKAQVDGAVHGRMQTATAERYINECKGMFREAEKREHEKNVQAKSSTNAAQNHSEDPNIPTTTEIWGAFTAWVAYLKKIEVFKEAVRGYDAGMHYALPPPAMQQQQPMVGPMQQPMGGPMQHQMQPQVMQSSPDGRVYMVPYGVGMPHMHQNYGIYAMAGYGNGPNSNHVGMQLPQFVAGKDEVPNTPGSLPASGQGSVTPTGDVLSSGGSDTTTANASAPEHGSTGSACSTPVSEGANQSG